MGEQSDWLDGRLRLIERFQWLTRPGHDGDTLTLRIGAEANEAQRKTRHSVIPANEYVRTGAAIPARYAIWPCTQILSLRIPS
jgi:hypothetical protein